MFGEGGDYKKRSSSRSGKGSGGTNMMTEPTTTKAVHFPSSLDAIGCLRIKSGSMSHLSHCTESPRFELGSNYNLFSLCMLLASSKQLYYHPGDWS